MIRSFLSLVPEAQRRLIPWYLAAVGALSIAQGMAYVALAPLLEALLRSDVGTAWRWTLGIIVALVVVAITSYVQAMAGLRIGMGLMRDLQTRLGDHLGTLPLGWFSTQTSGSASRVIVASTNEVLSVFAHLLTPLITSVSIPVVVAIAMLGVDWRISLAMVVSAPLLYMINRWGNRLYGGATEVQFDTAVRTNNQVVEFAQAQPVLRVFGGDQAHERQLISALREQRSSLRRALWTSVPGLALFSVVVQLTLVLLVWVIITLATGGGLSAPLAVALIVVSSRFVEPLNQAAELSSAIRRARTAARRIHALLDTPAIVEPAEPRTPSDATLRFDDVRFGYTAEEPVLDGVSFTVPAGRTTAIVGPSGSGKTTLLRLASRFYEPDAGHISIGGIDLREIGTDTTLAQFSLVFQDVYLFDQSVLENVRVGRPDATDDEVYAAARVARVDEIVERLPDGWDTRVGEGGAALSGGERQRVSVARALLKDAPIVLLDEATSALDPQNEAAVVTGIRELTRGRTVLVVAHRLQTTRHADQILFLDDGRIVEQGTHAELLVQDGRYARFWTQRDRASGWRLDNRVRSQRQSAVPAPRHAPS